jgi:chemotaxis protein MotB
VAAEIRRTYPDQVIGVEGFTDSDPIQNSQWVSNHQLSVGRAMAVYDYLTVRNGMRPEQLFVVGHGSNHPVVSNATPAGKERNRRVELVIYPETTSAR